MVASRLGLTLIDYSQRTDFWLRFTTIIGLLTHLIGKSFYALTKDTACYNCMFYVYICILNFFNHVAIMRMLVSTRSKSEGSKSSVTFRKEKVFFLLWDGSLQPPWSVVYLFVEGNCWHFVDIQHFKPTNLSLFLAASGRSYFLWCKFCLTIPVKKCMNHLMINIAFGTALNINSFFFFFFYFLSTSHKK